MRARPGAVAALRRVLARRVPRGRILAGAVLATIAFAGLGTAAAAQLDLDAGTLAAGSAATTSCQGGTPFAAELVSAPGGAAFETTAVKLDGVHADCGDQHYRVSVVTEDGQQLGEATGRVPAGGGSFTTSAFTAVPTVQIARVEVVIHS